MQCNRHMYDTLKDLTFCSQSLRTFVICCILFPSSSNAAGLLTDSVYLVSTGSPTFCTRKTQLSKLGHKLEVENLNS